MTAPEPSKVQWWPPIVYTAFGAVLGLILARFQDWLDRRAARKSFLRAVRAELTTLDIHLKGSLKDAEEYKEKFDKGERSLLHPAAAFQRGIFDTQIGKLKSVADPLIIEIVQFYDKLSNLERVKSYCTSVGFDLTGLDSASERAVQLSPKYYSALKEIIKRINDLLPVLSSLIAKLQQIG